MYFNTNLNVTVKQNVAHNIDVEADTSAVVQNNVVDESKIATDAYHGVNNRDWAGALWVGNSVNVSVESNSAGYVGASDDQNSIFKKNDASSVRALVASTMLAACLRLRPRPRFLPGLFLQ